MDRFKLLVDILQKSEAWLMERVLMYAKKQGYTIYPSSLIEAWRISVQELSKAIIKATEIYEVVPGPNPDEDYTKDPISAFAIPEAKRQRERGVELSHFLGLYKYYLQTFLDLLNEADFEKDYKEKCVGFVTRVFNRIEIGVVTAWTSVTGEAIQTELKETNRRMTNETNKILTIVESDYNPVLLLNPDNMVVYLNSAAGRLLGVSILPGKTCCSWEETELKLPSWLNSPLEEFISGDGHQDSFEITPNHDNAASCFLISMHKMLDPGEKFRGTVVILHDVTRQKETEEDLNQTRKVTEETDPSNSDQVDIEEIQDIETLGVLLDRDVMPVLEEQRKIKRMAIINKLGDTVIEAGNKHEFDMLKDIGQELKTAAKKFDVLSVDNSLSALESVNQDVTFQIRKNQTNIAK